MKRSIAYNLPRSSSTILFVREDDPAAVEAAAAAAKVAADAALQAKIDAAVEAATSGLKQKNQELLGKVVKAKELEKQFEGLDPVELKKMKDLIDADEDNKLIAEGKKHQVVEKYTERMRAQHKTELEAKDALVQKQAERADRYREAVLDNQIRIVTNGLHKSAVEDALLHARQIFSLDDKGNAVQLDAEGLPVLGKDGSTPFSPAEWIESQKELKPHWFPSGTSGSGANGTREAGGGASSIKRADFEKLSTADRAKKARSGIKIID
jgi:hypothetical protein